MLFQISYHATFKSALLLAGLFGFVPFKAKAQDFDFNMSSQLRSYPLSGLVSTETGYGRVLWGDPESKSPFYGYIRPSLDTGAAPHFHTYGGHLELFPVSFFGFIIGQNEIKNKRDYTAYPCEFFLCQGRFSEAYVEGRVYLAYENFFTAYFYKSSKMTEKNKDKPELSYIHPVSGLALKREEDRLTTQVGVLGYELSESLRAFLLGIHYRSDEFEEQSHLWALNLAYKKGSISVSMGVGEFKSPIKKKRPTALFQISWSPLSRLGH